MKTIVKLTLVEDSDGNIEEVYGNIPSLEKEENGHFFIKCPLFKTFGYSSESIEKARENHNDDLLIFFKAHIKNNSLRSALNQLGWSKTIEKNKYEPPNIPSYLLQRSINQNISLAIN